jgi:hypothetical protein
VCKQKFMGQILSCFTSIVMVLNGYSSKDNKCNNHMVVRKAVLLKRMGTSGSFVT